MKISNIELYVVRNQEGKWFRAKGFGGGGKSWVDDIKDAKFYPRIGPAKSRVTFFSKNYPKFGIPEIVKITAIEAEVIDQQERVQKVIEKKQRAKERDNIQRNKDKIEKLEKQIAESKKELSRLKG